MKKKEIQYVNLKERQLFHKLISTNSNYFGNIKKSKLPVKKKVVEDTYYEELTDVGYHPDLRLLTASIKIKKPVGYSGNLCSNGSVEYVRFYLDYGSGWVDQGYCGVNVHDIPSETDYEGALEKPLTYIAEYHINPKSSDDCEIALLPKVKAILSWNSIPPADTPDFQPVWGNKFECNIQIKHTQVLEGLPIAISEMLKKVVENPNLSLSQLLQTSPSEKEDMEQFAKSLQPKQISLHELKKIYKEKKADVKPHRMGFPVIKAIQNTTDTQSAQKQIEMLKSAGFEWDKALAGLNEVNADINYEELLGTGIDISKNDLAATIKIKRATGYSGSLCFAGSYEYVAFWADWEDDGNWSYLGTASVNVHDISLIPASGLFYTARLNYDFSTKLKYCNTPYVVKIRAVLSWATPPSTVDPDDLETFGNYKESYIQIPTAPTSETIAVFNIIGGIPVDKIDDVTGLTTAGAKFALNQVAVESGAPFAGRVVIQGPLFDGERYRIKVKNLNTLASYYITDSFVVVGSLPHYPYVQYTLMTAEEGTGYFTYLSNNKNTDSILARWTPGTNDLWEVTLEIEGAGFFTKRIQMDNQPPVATLVVNDGGDCRHYHIGDSITGQFSAHDNYISSYQLSSSVGSFQPPASGTVIQGNTNIFSQSYEVDSGTAPSPCGGISLVVWEKTIHDSQWTGNYRRSDHIICLQS